MADEFKTYDKTPIVGIFRSNKWGFGLREIILIIIAALLLVLVLIFAGLFGRAESELASGPPSASAIVGNSYCTDVSCLKTAARAVELMNKSVDPCENFFEYACGNYKVVKPFNLNLRSRTVLDDMYNENEDRLIGVLETPISRMHDYAAERKMKEFFTACNDMYTRERNKGTPFINQVVTALGGWKALGNWDPNWDLNTALKKVQTDFWVDALYSPYVHVDWYQTDKRTIALSPGGTGKWMEWSWYISPYMEQQREDYKKFIRRVGSFLVRDAVDAPLKDDTLKQQYIEEFVNDTFTIEYNIATIARGSRYTDVAAEENKVTLQDFNTETGNVIDWVDQMTYFFNTAGVTANTEIRLSQREYFRNMTDMIASLPNADRNRMLHNYLIWRVAEDYVQDLSWEYVHANREIYVDLYGRPSFSGLYKYCFYQVQRYMNDALSSLFIAEHFVEDSKKAVTEITDNIKLALQSQLDKTPWMDEETKKYAKEKLDAVVFKMGYPDWIANTGYIDQLYNGLTVNVSDFFGSLLSANQFHRAMWNEDLKGVGENREEWVLSTYDTTIGAYLYWNEIIAPAGILQTPIYSKDQPHYSTFGSLGSLLGRFLHHVVDEWGKYHDKTGEDIYPDTWWSNKSLADYASVRSCVVDAYTNVSKKYQYPDGEWRPIPVEANMYTPLAIAWTNGIRLAQIGYKDWLKSKGLAEKMLPGLGMTNEQMIYLAHAQTFCYARDPRESFYRALQGKPEEDIIINMSLGELQEFSDAFNCKPESTMNHAKKCSYY